MILYGRNAVREALRGKRRVRRVWASERFVGEDWPTGVDVWRATDRELAARCDSPDHQGVCAEVDPYPYADPASVLEDPESLVLALDEVQDPHNLGAVCRVAEVAGAAGVVIPERRAVEVTPAVCRSSAGAVEHLAIARVGNLADWLVRAKGSGAWVYGADGDAGVPYDGLDYAGKVVLVLGSEGRGLRPRVAAACDELVALPRHGRVESLNVSAAAAALVYGILHRREVLDRGP